MTFCIRNRHPIRLAMIIICLVVYATGFAGSKPAARSDSLTASKVFADIPLQVLDMLRPSTRLDMIDYYEQADSLLTVTDALGGSSRLEEVAPDYLKVSVTPVSTLEIKLLPYKKGRIVMTLYTVGGTDLAKDTEVRFFDADLQPMPTSKFLKAPDIRNFFNLKGSGVSMSDLMESVPFSAIEYTTGPADTPLTATFNTLSTLSDETRNLLAPLLIPSLSSTWNDKFRF
ncbi:MAG: DUF3256 family protein [Muribaculaceae bacterium]|nr:DUF3256 family protein [Muribaculaceae bacterium]